MIEDASNENIFVPNETGRRRSTFYVSLVNTNTLPSANSSLHDTDVDNALNRSLDHIYNPGTKTCSNFEWSRNDSDDSIDAPPSTKSLQPASSAYFSTDDRQRHGRDIKLYASVLNGTSHMNDVVIAPKTSSEFSCQKSTSNTDVLIKSRSRTNILCLADKNASGSPSSSLLSPLKEKARTLPQNLSPKITSAHSVTSGALDNRYANGVTHSSTFPPKYSFLMKSTPKMLHNYSSSDRHSPSTFITSPSSTCSASTCHENDSPIVSHADAPISVTSPRKALSFIRRAHSTKLSRSSSLLKSITSKCVDQDAGNLFKNNNKMVRELPFDRFEECFRSDQFYELIRNTFMKDAIDVTKPVTSVDAKNDNSHASAIGTAVSTTTIDKHRETDADKCDSGMNLTIAIETFSFLFFFFHFEFLSLLLSSSQRVLRIVFKRNQQQQQRNIC